MSIVIIHTCSVITFSFSSVDNPPRLVVELIITTTTTIINCNIIQVIILHGWVDDNNSVKLTHTVNNVYEVLVPP